MRDRKPMPLEDLSVYCRGVHFATVALRGRYERLHGDGPLIAEIERYQEMIKRYRAAAETTLEMR